MALATRTLSFSCKSHIFRTHNHLQEHVWQQQNPNYVDSLPQPPPRPSHLPFLLLSCNLRLHSHSFPLRHCFLLPTTPFLSLFRPCTPSFSPTMSSLTTPPPSSESNSTSTTPAIQTNRVVIKGRVQGVLYRDWTVRNATELGLKGWVRNRRDGSVESLFSGPSEKVDEMLQRCRRGPPAASVTGLEAFPSDEDPGTVFERRRTA